MMRNALAKKMARRRARRPAMIKPGSASAARLRWSWVARSRVSKGRRCVSIA